MSTTLKVACVAIWIVVLAMAAWLGGGVPFEIQWPLYEALRNTSAIIFAVVGAWLAIVFPERLKVGLRYPNAPTAATDDGSGTFSKLLLPIVSSTIILAIVLAVGLIAPLAVQFSFVTNHVYAWRAVSYVLLAGLTLLQIWSVALTLVPASDIRDKMQGDASVRATTGAIFSHARKPGRTKE